MSTAEVESALILHKGVAETAVVGCADDVTGQAVHAFVTMKPEFDTQNVKEAELNKELIIQVRKVIGPFAAPKKIYLVSDLPKTRSGKILRSTIKKIADNVPYTVTPTIEDPLVLDEIKASLLTAKL